MKNTLCLTVTVVFLSFSSISYAGFLRIIPNIRVAESERGHLLISGTIENQGDETAQAVMIEAIRNGKILSDMGPLGSGEKKELTVSIAEKDLDIEREGLYNIPLRVLYKDMNHVAFSAAFITAYTKRGESGALGRSSPISIALDEVVQKTGGVDIAKSGNFALTLANPTTTAIQVNLEFVGTKEVEIKGEKEKINLGPEEEKTIEVTVKNLTALPGSSYASYVLLSGIAEDQWFSDYLGFVINIRTQAEIPLVTWLLGVLIIIFGIVGYIYWRKESELSARQD